MAEEKQFLLFEDNLKTLDINNRRYLGSKYRLLSFIHQVVEQNCSTNWDSILDLFAGTGVVASSFSGKKLMTNDILYSNYLCHAAWLGRGEIDEKKLAAFLTEYNQLNVSEENYMSENFGDTYFSSAVCRNIGAIREDIEKKYEEKELTFRERAVLIASLLYGIDRIANTCGHYDAWRSKEDRLSCLELFMPAFQPSFRTLGNQCFNEDANDLVLKVSADLVYIDPPYNSRQYCDTYHLLENVARWEKPKVFGKARKMDRNHLKSRYCTREAAAVFDELIQNIKARYILVSYNNMAENGNARSNAKITDTELLSILSKRGEVQVFSTNYKAFSTGRSWHPENEERLFLANIK
ncbi:MAG: DNA adenine methylase [Thermoguttaceae bacterium]|nr:DNA adenine methylase [Thermoguttaceae bacterium]